MSVSETIENHQRAVLIEKSCVTGWNAFGLPSGESDEIMLANPLQNQEHG